MKRMKNKGFTMIELLGVITLLGIIALICIPSVSKLLKNVGNSYYKAIEKNVKSAGTDYYTDNKDLLPDDVGKTAIVYVGDKTNSNNSLVGLSYIEEVVDRNKNTCGYYGETKLSEEYSYVIVNREYKDAKREETKYTYTSCMHCLGDNYNTSESDYQYCNSSYKPQNNRYIKAPVNYYLQLSAYDYTSSKLTNEKTVGEETSTYQNFELRKAGIRDNDGKQIIDQGIASTISPSKIELVIDGKIEKKFTTTTKDGIWNELNNAMQEKVETWESYLKNHTVKLKLIYAYEYQYVEGNKQKIGTRTAETYITLTENATTPIGSVTIKNYYMDEAKEEYYTSIPLKEVNTNESYNYSYNVNHKNIQATYQSLVTNTIMNDQIYHGVNEIAWVNRGIKVKFSAEGAIAFECSYDKQIWYPCESQESYNYTFNQDIYVRGISMYGTRGPINEFPIKVDVEDVVLTTTIDSITGNNNWYVNDVNISGQVTDTTSGIRYTRMCTTTQSSCDPLIQNRNTNNTLNFTQLHSEETRGITYCYKAINNAGSTSQTVCRFIKLDKTKPSCGSCTGGSTSWTNGNRTITCTGSDSTSGLASGYTGQSKTYNSGTTKQGQITYTVKDNAGNENSCTQTQNVYVDKDPPTISSIELNDSDTCSDSSGVSAIYTVSDSDSGVAQVKDYWGTNAENFEIGFSGAIDRGANTNIISAYGTNCYSAGQAATKGAWYYIKIYARDKAGNVSTYHAGPVQANG